MAKGAIATAVTSWDIFHADRLELERRQTTEAVRASLARGDLRDDDLVRPAGTTIPWARIAEIPELFISASEPAVEPGPTEHSASPRGPRPENQFPDFEELQPGLEGVIPPAQKHRSTELPGSSTSDVAFPVLEEREPSPPRVVDSPVPNAPVPTWDWDEDDDEHEKEYGILSDQQDIEILADGDSDEHKSQVHGMTSRVALPVVQSRDRDSEFTPDEEEHDISEFSLSRSATQRIEELDLAPMVDVAFQLVLFFMVTATTILYKTLEIPKPSADAPPGAVAQGRSRSLDDLKNDYVLVEIDDRGAMKLDHQPIEPVRETLVENLRRARERTGRKAMLLSADSATLHRHAVLAYDAAHEIGLSIAIAKPQAPQGPAPTLRAAPATAPKAVPKASTTPAPL
jgi:biopolymer transport protein ExbD